MSPVANLPLTILEEFLLLAHDPISGQFHPMPRGSFDAATGAAVLMDLTLRQRIDNDLQSLFVVEQTPTGDDLLDPTLQLLALAPVVQPLSIGRWVHDIAEEAEALRERALRRLEMHALIKRDGGKITRFPGKERYSILGYGNVLDINQRLRGSILEDAVPLPHDIMLTALAQTCGLFRFVYESGDLATLQPRIEQVARMDMIGQAVAKAVGEIETAMAVTARFR